MKFLKLVENDPRALTPKILSAIVEEQTKDQRPPDDWVHCSEVGTCPMKIALRLSGIKGEFSQGSYLNFFIGKLIHSGYQRVLVGKVLESAEATLRLPSLKLVGHDDGHGQTFVAEFKTMSKDARRIGNRPQRHHVLQITAYLKLLEKNQGNLIYIDKSNGQLEEYILEFDDADWAEIVKRIALARKFEEELKNPWPDKALQNEAMASECLFYWESWECGYCQFARSCPIKDSILLLWKERRK